MKKPVETGHFLETEGLIFIKEFQIDGTAKLHYESVFNNFDCRKKLLRNKKGAGVLGENPYQISK
ncbi:MAG: hypothetical protein EB053_06515 [Chlamydiae bacterium]|nr:hypothetical protein [Chlamydiota bacterium]